jgi:hypothetical protein
MSCVCGIQLTVSWTPHATDAIMSVTVWPKDLALCMQCTLIQELSSLLGEANCARVSQAQLALEKARARRDRSRRDLFKAVVRRHSEHNTREETGHSGMREDNNGVVCIETRS